jgi:uracil phosphoribosyltransferase
VPLRLIDHPVAHDALVELRDKRCTPASFRLAARRVSLILATEALRDLPYAKVTVETPLGLANGTRIASDVVIVPVLRAGLGMLDAILELIPSARVGHVGLQRDEVTAVAAQYYAKLPEHLSGSVVIVADPMLATGGSAVAALDLLKRAGAQRLALVCIVAAPEGVARLERHHPDVSVYTPAVDSRLDSRSFIVPGLGDFGDRLYATDPRHHGSADPIPREHHG